jgi:ornithine decarboxylase
MATTCSSTASTCTRSESFKNCSLCRHEVSILPDSVEGILDCARHEIARLEASVNSIEDEDALDDGFLCIDLNVLTTKLRKWYEMFGNIGSRSNGATVCVTPFFAIKCNPDQMLTHFLARHTSGTNSALDIGFDCASLLELELAKQELFQVQVDTDHDFCGPSGTKRKMQRIVYANPQRAENDLLKSLNLVPHNQPLWLTLDGVEELYKMKRACAQEGRDPCTLHLIFRILVPDSHSQIPLGEKFGTTLESIKLLVHTALELGFAQIIGVSFHCGSGCHDPETYEIALDLARQALTLIDEEASRKGHSTKCWLLDIGGGFPGDDGLGGDTGRFSGRSPPSETDSSIGGAEPKKESTAEIAKAVRPKLVQLIQDRPDLQIIAEPGRYFVEASACLVSRIYKTWKESSSGIMVYQIAHGVHGVFKDVLLCNEAFVPQGLRHPGSCTKAGKDSTNEKTLISCQVRGPSGDPQDVVCAHCLLPQLRVGDWLIFDRMGAYTLSIATRTGRPEIRYVLGGSADILTAL